MKPKVMRIIDVNLNRSREAIRVIEDTLRFVYNDKRFFIQLKNLRHRLDRSVIKIYPELLKARSSDTDTGKDTIEAAHRDIKALAFANFNRAKESLRVLEEYTRLNSGLKSSVFKKIRFKVYSLEKEIEDKFFAKKN
ncbi:MAG: thiamine-phosphate pyrophosphorylase [Elusimicrobiota bacterium]